MRYAVSEVWARGASAAVEAVLRPHRHPQGLRRPRRSNGRDHHDVDRDGGDDGDDDDEGVDDEDTIAKTETTTENTTMTTATTDQ